MLVSHQYKFIFLKTMKVAGTSVEAVMDKYCLPPNKDWKIQLSRKESITKYGISTVRGLPHGADVKWQDHLGAFRTKQYVNEIDPKIFETYIKFSIIRNPWDKVVSWYHWNHPSLKIPFDKFVLETVNDPLDRHVYCINNRSICDFHIKYENLLGDMKELYNKLNISGADQLEFLMPNYLNHVRTLYGKNLKKHYSTYYTNQATIDKVAKVYDKEIEWFNYKFKN